MKKRAWFLIILGIVIVGNLLLNITGKTVIRFGEETDSGDADIVVGGEDSGQQFPGYPGSDESSSDETRGGDQPPITTTQETAGCYGCPIDGYLYDPSLGGGSEGILPGTSWSDVPTDFVSPSGACSKEEFIIVSCDELLTASCGNGICDAGETLENCPEDCNQTLNISCGNGICEEGLGENEITCPEDCNGTNVTYTSQTQTGGAGGGGTTSAGSGATSGEEIQPSEEDSSGELEVYGAEFYRDCSVDGKIIFRKGSPPEGYEEPVTEEDCEERQAKVKTGPQIVKKGPVENILESLLKAMFGLP